MVALATGGILQSNKRKFNVKNFNHIDLSLGRYILTALMLLKKLKGQNIHMAQVQTLGDPHKYL